MYVEGQATGAGYHAKWAEDGGGARVLALAHTNCGGKYLGTLAGTAQGDAPVFAAACAPGGARAKYQGRGAKAGGAAEEGGYNWRGEGDGGADEVGTDGACLRPRFRGCERGGAPRARPSAFCAVDSASGAAFLPELTPTLYGSVIFNRGCFRLRLAMRSVAVGSGGEVVAGRRLFRHCAPIRSAVSAHVLC